VRIAPPLILTPEQAATFTDALPVILERATKTLEAGA
jgi:acetylornithine/succinyldiaminopimelate/putrescine aminotransferase